MKTLFLAWQDEGIGVPDERPSRAWYPVGRLDQAESFYRFSYIAGVRRAAQEANFRAFDAFPKFEECYESATLFPFFRMRVPDPSREDYGDYVSRLDLSPEAVDPMDVLAVSGGRRQTDHLEVFPKIQPRRDGRFRCRFFLHGWRHVSLPPQQRLARLKPGEPLRVALEMNNPATGKAVLLLTTDDYQTLGWAPRYLVGDMFAAIANFPGELAGEVVRINLPPAPANQRALIELNGRFPSAYEPMSSADFELLVPLEAGTGAKMRVLTVAG
jgi:hypothetical protein